MEWKGRTGNGTGTETGTGTERDFQSGRNRNGNGEREGPVRAGQASWRGGKNATLVGGVQEYWGFYAEEGADTVWDL